MEGDEGADDGFSDDDEGGDLDGEAEQQTRVVRSNSFEAKPLTVEEASLRLTGAPSAFIVYRDADSSRINVLYKMDSGEHGLIDPDR